MAKTLLCVFVLAVHLVGGVAAIGLLPRGFALADLHCWTNTIIPAVASLAVLVTLIHAIARRSMIAPRILVVVAAGGWVTAVVTGAILFPDSMTIRRLIVPAIIALGLVWLGWQKVRVWLPSFAIGSVLGVVVIVTQRAPLPSTHPAGGTLLEIPEGTGAYDIAAPCGRSVIRVNPLLTFISRSPDRTWTLLSPIPTGSHRTLTRYRATATGFEAGFTDDGQSTLAVRRDDPRIDIDAVSQLSAPVYSHLDSFTSIELPFAATISFGPTGAARFPIEPADYPSGRPIQLAYVDADAQFHVARADDAEKGPYTTLASGHLGRGEPLAIELRARDGNAGCRIVFLDWSAQISTEPSPTAGWGIPQSSIQFFSNTVFLTLADTGPGRGFDSVGHAAGTYRNRVRIEPIP